METRDSPVAAPPGSSHPDTTQILMPQTIELLKAEHAREASSVDRQLGQNEKVVQFSLMVLAALAYVGTANQSPVALSFVPFGLLALLLYITNAHEFAMISQGRIAALEECLNGIVGADVLVWEHALAKDITHYRATTCALAVIGLCVHVGALVLTWSTLSAQVGAGWTVVLIGAWAAGTLLAASRLSRLSRLRDETTERCRPTYARLVERIAVQRRTTIEADVRRRDERGRD
jgi:hypothetical protein